MTDDEISKAARDAFTHGTGFMRDGKHVPTEDVYMTVEDVVTDDLVKRLREEIAVFGCPTKRRNPDGPEAADRIESQMQLIGASGEAIGAMLARIEKMEEALRRISDDGNWGPDGCWDAASYPDEIARVALGEEEEEDDV